MWIKINDYYLANLSNVKYIRIVRGAYCYRLMADTAKDEITLLSYNDKEKAEKALDLIVNALLDGEPVFIMPKENELWKV